MAQSRKIAIGFLGASAPSSPHHDSFRLLIPKDIHFTFVQEAGVKGSLYDARGKVDALVAQACLSRFAAANGALMKDYMKAVIHALVLLLFRRNEAFQIGAREPMRLMETPDVGEFSRRLDSMTEMLRVKPYPTAEAVMNSNEIAAHEYGAGVENPLTLWDIHWLKELDDEGFIDRLIASLAPASQR